MYKVLKLTILTGLFLLTTPVLADILVTTDGMVLNGKIIEDRKSEYIIFANNHGTFTIEYIQIKEIHVTGSYTEDIEILQKKGKKINADDAKLNYIAGEKKKKKKPDSQNKINPSSSKFHIEGGLFVVKNFGTIGSSLPYSFGLTFFSIYSISSNTFFTPAGIESRLDFVNASKDSKDITGATISIGPRWVVPIPSQRISAAFTFSPALGTGYYVIENGSRSEKALKFPLSLHAGPQLTFQQITVASRLKIEYIYDGYSSLFSVGAMLTAGYLF